MSKPRKLSTASILSLCALIVLIGFGAYQYMMAKTAVTADEFGARVRAYLLANPQVLREVFAELTKQENAAAERDRKERVAALSEDLRNDGFSFVAGNPDGDVTIVEFFDYRCGYCKRSFPDLMKTVEEDGNIRLVLKEFPVLGPESVLAAQAAIAAAGQDKYMELHRAMMSVRGGLTLERILNMATDVGIDTEKLQADMESEETRAVIEKNYRLAKILDIQGTPAFVIGDEFVPGAISHTDMLKFVAAAREKPAPAAGSES